MKFPLGLKRAAALCVLKNGGDFLLLKRNKEPNKNTYTPVGGKLEPFESPLQAAIRETYEETGITIAAMQYCGLLTESSPTTYNWTGYIYVAEIERVPPPPCDEGRLEWIPYERILDIPTPKTDWHIYQYILEQKPFAFSAEYNDQLDLLFMQEEIENKIIYRKS